MMVVAERVRYGWLITHSSQQPVVVWCTTVVVRTTESESSRYRVSESGSIVKKYFSMDHELQLKNHLAITVTKGGGEFYCPPLYLVGVRITAELR